MASVVFDIRKAVKTLSTMNRGLSDMTPLFREVSQAELSETLLRFRAEENPEGVKWEDSKTIRRGGDENPGPYTREQSWNYVLKSNFHAVPPGWHWFNRSMGDKVLRDTGTLMASISNAFGPNFGVVGTNLEYAKKHQEGDGVAKREMFGVSKTTEENVENAVNLFLGGLLR